MMNKSESKPERTEEAVELFSEESSTVNGEDDGHAPMVGKLQPNPARRSSFMWSGS